MKYFITLLIVPFLFAGKCDKKEDAIPTCIQGRIDSIKALPRWNPPAQVDEYFYNGQRVFLFSSDCCDQYNYLYTETCDMVCAPSGGFTGAGDRKCQDFGQTAKHIRLVWKDPR